MVVVEAEVVEVGEAQDPSALVPKPHMLEVLVVIGRAKAPANKAAAKKAEECIVGWLSDCLSGYCEAEKADDGGNVDIACIGK